jgi:6-pyruvoyltetrahydropterin/6-carboxytetrahydropterin synthase
MTQTQLKAEAGFIFESGKRYPSSIGLSCCFRQWKAPSHCRLFHGYSIDVSLVFGAVELDERNWVVDFGSLKSLKGWLEDQFDHKMLVAEDDPELEFIKTFEQRGLAEIRIMPQVGIEACSYWIYQYTEGWLRDNGYYPRCSLQQVEVKEHDANFARYRRL